LYAKDEPLFPFGFGLSYTSFEYSAMDVSPAVLSKDGNLQVSCILKNTGEYDGEEVVQAYIKYPDPKIPRPRIALKGFERVFLKKGETKKLTIRIDASELMYWDENHQEFSLPEEKIEIFMGASSEDLRLHKTIQTK